MGTFDSEGGAIEDFERTVSQFTGNFIELRFGSGSGVLAKLGQSDRTIREGAAEGSGIIDANVLPGFDFLEGVLEIRSPVDLGRDDEGVRASRSCGSVVGDVRDVLALAGRRSSPGVSVLRDQNGTMERMPKKKEV